MRVWICLGIAGLVVLLGATGAAHAQYSFAPDPPGVNPAFGQGGFGYSNFGYSAKGPRGVGYYTGLYVPPVEDGYSPAYNPIFNAVFAGPESSRMVQPEYRAALNDRTRGRWPFRWLLRNW